MLGEQPSSTLWSISLATSVAYICSQATDSVSSQPTMSGQEQMFSDTVRDLTSTRYLTRELDNLSFQTDN